MFDIILVLSFIVFLTSTTVWFTVGYAEYGMPGSRTEQEQWAYEDDEFMFWVKFFSEISLCVCLVMIIINLNLRK